MGLSNGNITDAEEVWNIFWHQMIGVKKGCNGIIGHSANTYSLLNGSNAIFQSSDTGGTYTSRNTSLDADSFIKNCKANKTYGIAVESSATAESAYTINSGVGWTNGGALVNDTALYDLSFPTTTLAVVGCDDGGGDRIYRSTDNAVNWVAATTSPSATVFIVDMFDGTTGYCVDGNGNIWKTTDSADNWTDTTDNTTLNPFNAYSSMYAMTATTALILTVSNTNTVLDHYDNSTNTVTNLMNFGANSMRALGFVKLSNGYYYFGVLDVAAEVIWIFKTDNGTTFHRRDINVSGVSPSTLTCSLSEGGNSKLLVNTGGTFGNALYLIREPLS